MRRGIGGLVFVTAVSCSGSVRAEETSRPAERVAVVVDQRSALGSGTRRGMRVHRYGAGLMVRITPVLTSRLLLTGWRPDGRTDLGAPTPYGLGGEAGLHLTPWPSAWARPYLFASIGVAGFPGAAFLPGGSRYDFQSTGGGGVELSVDARWNLGVEVFGTHISNGQGIGEHNPAFDGYGAGLNLSYGLTPRARLDDPWASVEQPEPGTAALVDGAVGRADGRLVGAVRARLAQRLLGRLLLLVDGEAGELADEPYGEVGGAVATHVGPITMGAHGGYRRFIGIDTALAALQFEGHITPEVSLVAMAHTERDVLQGGFWRGALGTRVYPHPTLMLAGGIGAGPWHHRTADAEVKPYAAIEWALPLAGLQPFQLALFAERQTMGLSLVGLRLGYAVGQSPRDWSRQTGWRRLR